MMYGEREEGILGKFYEEVVREGGRKVVFYFIVCSVVELFALWETHSRRCMCLWGMSWIERKLFLNYIRVIKLQTKITPVKMLL